MIYMVYIFYFAIVLLMLYYLFTRIKKFNFIKNMSNKKVANILSIIPILVLFLIVFISSVNALTIIGHYFLFFVIFEFIYYIVNKIKTINTKYYIVGIISILFTSIYLVYGFYSAHNVVRTNYLVNTNKDIGVEKLRIVQISDSHIGATFNGNGFKKHIEEIKKVKPDVVVITGDFVDDDTKKKDMLISAEALGNLKTKYGIYFVFGNHDKGYFNRRDFDEKDLKNALEKNNVKVLEDKYIMINDNICILGRKDKSDLTRKNINKLTKNIDKNKYIIDLNHQPNDYDNETKSNIDLVLSGHTHGGQLLPITMFVGKSSFNDRKYGLEKRGNTTFIVNSGISDWALDFKTGTKSEYGVIDIIKK